MKKNISYIVFIAIVSTIIWSSCQKVDNPLKIIDQRTFPEIIDPIDTTGGDSLNFISKYVNYRQVLLEEFTGHLCVNCPEAAKLAHDLAESLDDKLIIYTIHAGVFAQVQNNNVFNTDLRSVPGDRIYTDFQIFANPMAMVNRLPYNGLYQIFKDNWTAAVTAEIQKPNAANMRVSNTYFPNQRILKVDVESEFLGQPQGEFKLVVFLVEDSIVSPQLNNNPLIGPDTLFNYVHRNVLRANVSPTYGTLLGDNGLVVAGEMYKKDYTFLISNDWVATKCRIIAYIGKNDPVRNLVGIIQVVELGIKIDE
jgi:hypothetical protein